MKDYNLRLIDTNNFLFDCVEKASSSLDKLNINSYDIIKIIIDSLCDVLCSISGGIMDMEKLIKTLRESWNRVYLISN